MIPTLTIDSWLKDILVDPISKQTLSKGNGGWFSSSGFKYKEYKGIPDFRIRFTQTEKQWKEGQDVFEEWLKNNYLKKGEESTSFYQDEIKIDAPMYEQLTLEGRVLDVGGQLGHIRRYMTTGQEYCSIDPFITAPFLVEGCNNLFKNYPYHLPLNFIGGFAEFLPFKDASFDTVNMRSCIDHFFSPEVALLEAYRVLKPAGKLIIGMSVEQKTLKNNLKEAARSILSIFNDKFKDHHIWHPEYDQLIKLCTSKDFVVYKEIWQSKSVVYIEFRKN
jgi:SAM-dependent methyltransferase